MNILQLLAKFKSGEDLPSAIVQGNIDLMKANSSLNAFVTEYASRAMAEAYAADKAWQQGKARSLEGLPILVKDIFCTKGDLTTAGSRMLSNFYSPYESTVTDKLRSAGAIMLGKTNMDEFAMGSTNTTSFFGPVINPWRSAKDPGKNLVPGGSSGGSAAALAAGIGMLALGTDTGGSVRQPAAFCGLVGLKPTYGRCSRFGMISYSSSLDHAGVFTRNVLDAALSLKHMAGYDAKDSTSSDLPVDDYVVAVQKGLSKFTVGVLEVDDSVWDNVLKENYRKLLERLKAEGSEVVKVKIPLMDLALAIYYVLTPAEASSNLARYDGVHYGFRAQANGLDDLYRKTRSQGFGQEVKRRLLIGSFVLASENYEAYYVKAQRARFMLAQQIFAIFKSCDVILTPTSVSAAFGIEETPTDPVQVYLNDFFTVIANLASIPAISLPLCLNSEGLPMGIQLMADKFKEAKLLAIAAEFERLIGDWKNV